MMLIYQIYCNVVLVVYQLFIHSMYGFVIDFLGNWNEMRTKVFDGKMCIDLLNWIYYWMATELQRVPIEINRCWAGGRILRCRRDPATSWVFLVVWLRHFSSSRVPSEIGGSPSLVSSNILIIQSWFHQVNSIGLRKSQQNVPEQFQSSFGAIFMTRNLNWNSWNSWNSWNFQNSYHFKLIWSS